MRTVRFTTDAKADLREIANYLDEHSPTATDDLVSGINSRLALIAIHPEISSERSNLIPALRSTLIGNYLLFYRINSSMIDVVRVLHGARDIDAEFVHN